MDALFEKFANTLPAVISAMIVSAGFTIWAIDYFETKTEASVINKTLDEYRSDIKAIRQDLDYIKGQLSK